MPHSSSGPRVAKILPPTRKSGWSMCDFSTAWGSLRARSRNSSAVTICLLLRHEPLNPVALHVVPDPSLGVSGVFLGVLGRVWRPAVGLGQGQAVKDHERRQLR